MATVVQSEGRSAPPTRRSRARGLAALPVIDLAALLADRVRVVVVAPHPDDEVLGCGGLIALAARRGMDVLIVSVTDGEACYPGHPTWTPQRLRAARARELSAALFELGADTAQTMPLHVADGGIETCIADLTATLAETLKVTDLVLTTAANDGHPDHEATHRGVAAVRQVIGFRLVEFKIWGCTDAGESRARAVRLPLDTATCRAKHAAIRCFKTQTGDCEPPIVDPVLPADVLVRFYRPHEVFYL